MIFMVVFLLENLCEIIPLPAANMLIISNDALYGENDIMTLFEEKATFSERYYRVTAGGETMSALGGKTVSPVIGAALAMEDSIASRKELPPHGSP